MDLSIGDQIRHGPFQKIRISIDHHRPCILRCIPDNGVVSCIIQVQEIYRHCSGKSHQICPLPLHRLDIIFQLGGQIQVINKVFHPDTLPPDDPGLLSGFFRKTGVFLQGAGVAHHHRKGGPDIMGYPGDPVGSGSFFLPQCIILGFQLFRHPVNGSGQLGHESFFRNIHFFLFSQGLYSLDNGLYRTDDAGGGHCVDNDDKDQIKCQKFQDHIADIPYQLIIKCRPHQFKIPVLGKAQK